MPIKNTNTHKASFRHYLITPILIASILTIVNCTTPQHVSAESATSTDAIHTDSNIPDESVIDIRSCDTNILESIQNDLVWTGDYNGIVDGIFGNRTRTALEKWKLRNGSNLGTLITKAERLQLSIASAHLRNELGWTLYTNEIVGYSIAYPGTFLKKAEPLKFGGRRWTTEDGLASLQVDVLPSVGDDYLDNVKKEYDRSGKHIRYIRQNDNWLVVSGIDSKKAFYLRLEVKNRSAIGFKMILPFRDLSAVEIIEVALANSFRSANIINPEMETPRSLLDRLDINNKEVGSYSVAPKLTPQENPLYKPSKENKSEKIKLSASQVFQNVKDSVFVVLALEIKNGEVVPETASQGSAVAISHNQLLTNCHVINDHDLIIITQDDSREIFSEAYVVKSYTQHDMCILRIKDTTLKSCQVGEYRKIIIGETVYAVGSPSGLDLTLSNGLVSAKREEDGIDYIQTTAAISPGSSGGGLFNEFGELIGITTFYLKDAQNLNFAISAEEYFTDSYTQ